MKSGRITAGIQDLAAVVVVQTHSLSRPGINVHTHGWMATRTQLRERNPTIGQYRGISSAALVRRPNHVWKIVSREARCNYI
jgi:hypothetical protein